jgi:hypothetical protein
LLLFALAPANADDPEDQRAALRTIIESLRQRTPHYIGAGSASVIIHENDQETERLLDFKFKDIMSRSDAYHLVNGQKADLEVLWSVNRDDSVTYNGYNAVLQNRPPSQFHREIGYDFHPETFNRIRQKPVWQILENILDGAAQINIRLEHNGILTISADYEFEDPTASEKASIALDSTKEYALVFWEHHTNNLNGGGSSMDLTYRAEWDKFDNHWYLKQLDFQEDIKDAVSDSEDVQIESSSYQAHITIRQFSPEGQIDDSEFTLAGLHLPAGTLIVDDIAGTAYRYGTGLISTRQLEEALLEADFVKRVAHVREINDLCDSPARGQEGPASSTQMRVDDATSRSSQTRNILLMLFLIVPVLFLVAVVCKKKNRVQ